MNRALVIFILVLMASCQTNERPKEVLTQAQLSAFLVDIYLAEARIDAIVITPLTPRNWNKSMTR